MGDFTRIIGMLLQKFCLKTVILSGKAEQSASGVTTATQGTAWVK
jgi:hypothetical protein